MLKPVHVLAASAVALSLFATSAHAFCIVQVPFASGSSAVSAASAQYLARLAQEYPTASIEISGHADAVGDAGANQALSNQRIDAVLETLRGNGGNPDIASRTASGEANQAVQSNAAQQANRRVDVRVPQCDPAIFADFGGVVQVAPAQAGGIATQTTQAGALGGTGISTAVGVIGVIVGAGILANITSTDGT